ncbi:unnamed protein product [Cuscuta campestris]|uniref:Uncharacterized protein n=1 Tax=Cuscuta campestris TaxID=132261 RepID=A0A484MIC3_9ASTE|nr:unnamed protein product [Cuscuta campestris]
MKPLKPRYQGRRKNTSDISKIERLGAENEVMKARLDLIEFTFAEHIRRMYGGNLPTPRDPDDADCWTPVDDLWQVDNSCTTIPPQQTPPPTTANRGGDLFYIEVDVEFWHGLAPEWEEEDGGGVEEVCKCVGRNVARSWEACPRVERGNLSPARASAVLSKAGVPLHKQEVEKVVLGADEVSNSPLFRLSHVLPLRVSVSLFACPCCRIHNNISS